MAKTNQPERIYEFAVGDCVAVAGFRGLWTVARHFSIEEDADREYGLAPSYGWDLDDLNNLEVDVDGLFRYAASPIRLATEEETYAGEAFEDEDAQQDLLSDLTQALHLLGQAYYSTHHMRSNDWCDKYAALTMKYSDVLVEHPDRGFQEHVPYIKSSDVRIHTLSESGILLLVVSAEAGMRWPAFLQHQKTWYEWYTNMPVPNAVPPLSVFGCGYYKKCVAQDIHPLSPIYL